ncbi:putative protein OS=Streptomyces fumanus OX=67302 GN=GCM10018772_25150 PE=4 SV=1 [Streptomyces fumanus]
MALSRAARWTPTLTMSCDSSGAQPKPGWSGVVPCEVLEAHEPSLLRYSWQDERGGEVTEVAHRRALA